MWHIVNIPVSVRGRDVHIVTLSQTVRIDSDLSYVACTQHTARSLYRPISLPPVLKNGRPSENC